MTVAISGKYLGSKKVELVHEPSGSIVVTEAPRENGGEGKSFSPTDLVAAALGSCILTTIALVAERNGLKVDGMSMHVEKNMNPEPRRLGYLPVRIHLPKALLAHERQKLERAGLACPVHRSLSAEVQAVVTYVYDVEG
jgi:putative redox protein